MNMFPLKTSTLNHHLSMFGSDAQVKAIWTQDARVFDFIPSEVSSTVSIQDETSQQSQTSNSSNNSEFAMEVEVPPNEDSHSDLIHTDPQLVNGNPASEGGPKRKFCSLTQRRKKLVDKYIHEVLTKSKDYDYGEFGSNLWSALLLEYFREDKDSQVGIESIEHWAKHTSWGRRMRKAYDIGIQTAKDGGDGLREFEVAKAEIFRKKFEDVNSKRGRRKKCDTPIVEADPNTVTGMLNDHDYCKNPWLETFGTACSSSTEMNEQVLHSFVECEVEDQMYDMGAIGGEVEV